MHCCSLNFANIRFKGLPATDYSRNGNTAITPAVTLAIMIPPASSLPPCSLVHSKNPLRLIAINAPAMLSMNSTQARPTPLLM